MPCVCVPVCACGNFFPNNPPPSSSPQPIYRTDKNENAYWLLNKSHKNTLLWSNIPLINYSITSCLILALAACYENAMSSTKPEGLNVPQRRQRRTKPWPHVTCTKTGKDRPCSFRVMWACRQTDSQTHHNTSDPSQGPVLFTFWIIIQFQFQFQFCSTRRQHTFIYSIYVLDKGSEVQCGAAQSSEELAVIVVSCLPITQECYRYFMLHFRKTRRSSAAAVLFLFPAVRSPHTLKILSVYACEAGAEIRSRAIGPSEENRLFCCIQ